MSEQDIYLEKLHCENGITEAEFQGSAAGHFAALVCEQFEASGAVNYVELNLTSPNLGALTLSMQRANGLTPAKKVDMLCKLVRSDDMDGLRKLVSSWDTEQSEASR